MESFFNCAHFCPTYWEGTLHCQDFTYMNESHVHELSVQNHEILYAYHLLSIITLYSIY